MNIVEEWIKKRKIRIIIYVLLAIIIVFISGCITTETACNKPYYEYKAGECCLDENDNKICDKDEQTTKTEETKPTPAQPPRTEVVTDLEEQEKFEKEQEQPPRTEVVTDPVIQRAEPYISKIVFDNLSLRAQAASIVSECPSGDKECQVNKLYRYVVENYNYYSDPRSKEFIQSPSETMYIKGGDCEDLTILLNSLLENLGIKTYVVLTKDHAYSLACGIDTDNLWKYIQEAIITQFSKDFDQKDNLNIVVENRNLFIVNQKSKTFVLKAGNIIYYGGDGSKFTSPIEYMNIKYNISSSQPLTIYVVPSRTDYELMAKGYTFTHYPSCQNQNILRISNFCDTLTNNGGLILKNDNWYDATVDLNIKFYYLYLSAYELVKDQKITYYKVDNQECIVLDATAGKYGYPGYNANLTGKKIAIDPITKKYMYLE